MLATVASTQAAQPAGPAPLIGWRGAVVDQGPLPELLEPLEFIGGLFNAARRRTATADHTRASPPRTAAAKGHRREGMAYETGGLRSAHGRVPSSWAASDSSVVSPLTGATICTAIGRPLSSRPAGSAAAGWPR
jgi:hypothetical protein